MASKEMEGIWNGTLDANGRQLRLVFKMSNQADGKSTGSIVNIDQGGIESPVAITQKGANPSGQCAKARLPLPRK